MSRKLVSALLILFLTNLAVAALAIAQHSCKTFEPPDVVTATDIPYPPNTVITGLVTLLLSLGENGQVQNLQVVRDTPPLMAAAQTAVQKWSFKAASSNGPPVASALPVHVVFNPYDPGGTAITGLSLTPPPPIRDSSPFVPPHVIAAS